MSKQAESPDPSPDELLRFCEMEIQRRRATRQTNSNRPLIITGALLLVVIGAIGALMVLFSMLRDMPRPEHAFREHRNDNGTLYLVHSVNPTTRHASC